MNTDNRRTLGLPLPRLAAIFGLATSVVIIAAVVFSSQIETSTADLAGSVREIANHRFAAEASAWLFAFGLIGFAPFFLGLATALGERVSGLARVGALLLIGFSVINAPANLVPFVIAHDLGAGIRAGDQMSQAVAEGLLGLFQVVDSMAHAVFAIGAVLTAAAMVAVGRYLRLLAPVLAVAALAMILFALSVVIPALEPALVVGSALTLIWTIGSCVWLLRPL